MYDMDYDLESQYEDRFERPDDYNVFEENQLALDNEFEDEYYDEDEDEDELWDETTEIFTPDGLEPPF
jgi:hypothetical protein